MWYHETPESVSSGEKRSVASGKESKKKRRWLKPASLKKKRVINGPKIKENPDRRRLRVSQKKRRK